MHNNTPRTCHICGEISGREATQEEHATMVPPPDVYKEHIDGKWTGKHICSRCKTKNYTQKRRAETAPIPSNIKECRTKYNIILRIVKGLPVCIERGTSQVIHQGIGCDGCKIGTKRKT